LLTALNALDALMQRSVVHPTTRLILWLLLMLAIQWLEGGMLAVVFLPLLLLGRPVLQRGGRLVRRARWLLVSLFVIFAWGVAGEPLWQGIAAPTWEGLWEALTQLGRLLLMLMTVAAFLESMPLPCLLTATHRMLHPLQRCGIDPDRGMIRLMLVMRYVETLPRPRDWRTLLDAPAASVSEVLEIDEYPLRWLDGLVLFSVAAVLMALVLR
jgi:energy-coupling factor transporter transmembrane protein EcfT